MIRFPNGDYEYELSRRAAPAIGETVRRNGELWKVVRITQSGAVTKDEIDTVHVERVKDAKLGRGSLASTSATGFGLTTEYAVCERGGFEPRGSLPRPFMTDDRTSDVPILRLRFLDGEVEIRWTSKELPVGPGTKSRCLVAREQA